MKKILLALATITVSVAAYAQQSLPTQYAIYVPQDGAAYAYLVTYQGPGQFDISSCSRLPAENATQQELMRYVSSSCISFIQYVPYTFQAFQNKNKIYLVYTGGVFSHSTVIGGVDLRGLLLDYGMFIFSNTPSKLDILSGRTVFHPVTGANPLYTRMSFALARAFNNNSAPLTKRVVVQPGEDRNHQNQTLPNESIRSAGYIFENHMGTRAIVKQGGKMLYLSCMFDEPAPWERLDFATKFSRYCKPVKSGGSNPPIENLYRQDSMFIHSVAYGNFINGEKFSLQQNAWITDYSNPQSLKVLVKGIRLGLNENPTTFSGEFTLNLVTKVPVYYPRIDKQLTEGDRDIDF